jgi:hypothetical protein
MLRSESIVAEQAHCCGIREQRVVTASKNAEVWAAGQCGRRRELTSTCCGNASAIIAWKLSPYFSAGHADNSWHAHLLALREYEMVNSGDPNVIRRAQVCLAIIRPENGASHYP